MKARTVLLLAATAASLGFATPAALANTLPVNACVSGSTGAGVGSGQVGPVSTPPESVTVPVDECTP